MSNTVTAQKQPIRHPDDSPSPLASLHLEKSFLFQRRLGSGPDYEGCSGPDEPGAGYEGCSGSTSYADPVDYQQSQIYDNLMDYADIAESSSRFVFFSSIDFELSDEMPHNYNLYYNETKFGCHELVSFERV
ncbi:hypothetical protein M8J76_009396 [Diaphorina citri]|jgi:hypothetical protein|nr:hypothetical protein M8J75_001903 [Diaphorina citri]KAI5749695.1 hypothetical protein M8J76_009396 [Diaphorina citri]KAI5755288.1 hypothetical protein M8J77_015714 [Diaphorina citri]